MNRITHSQPLIHLSLFFPFLLAHLLLLLELFSFPTRCSLALLLALLCLDLSHLLALLILTKLFLSLGELKLRMGHLLAQYDYLLVQTFNFLIFLVKFGLPALFFRS